MARDPQAALVALNRFGFGARGGSSGDFISAASDPRGFVKTDLTRPNGVLLEAPGLQSTPTLGQALFAYQFDLKQQREAATKAGTPMPAEAKLPIAQPAKSPTRGLSLDTVAINMAASPAMNEGSGGPGMSSPVEASDVSKPPPQPLNVIQKNFRAEALARLQRATIADCGFVERLVVFWSNHFCISANKGEPARMWAGSFEREAIRPHVLGRFSDMLKAVEQHPAMLFFLDNQQSLGPDSRAGQNRKRGLNENLAREILELHTLGVGGGYSQEDVTSLARIITGWTYVGREGKLGPPGSFVFHANAHQPGAQRLLGKLYDDNGVAQGEAALLDIARHPSTAKFIATKFARHFVADDPPPVLIAKLQKSFRKSDGDLKALAATLVDSDEAWRTPLAKLRSPYEFLVATGRLLTRIPEEPGRYLNGLNMLGQPLWTPAGPNGFPDSNAAWAAPEGMKLRLDISAQLSSKIADSIDPRELLDVMAGDAASPETRQTVQRAEVTAAGPGPVADVARISEEMTMDCCESRISSATTRRSLLLGGSSFAAWAYLPKFARAADGRDPRLIVVILRGALDGLATVAPIGDPDYAGLHGSIALTSDGPHAAAMLDSFFALHPSMPELARMYREKHAAVVHAVATPYRDRSHFDGQDVLESGYAGPGRVQSGWLNRALEALPRGEQVMSGLAVGPTTPLVLRGAAPTVGWSPVALPPAADDTAMRLLDLYQHRDPALAAALSQGLQLDKTAQQDEMKPKPNTNSAGAMRLVARGAAKLMAADDGPRIAALAFDGWDTHANEGGPVGRLANLLSGLDGALAEFESGLGEHWRHTVIVVATEFGRTARINGTDGTDHGTGTVALLAGGAVKGGRVISDWPGLRIANLYESRDLAPTTDLRAVLKGVLHYHLGVSERVLSETVFPDSSGVKAMKGLVG